MCIRDRDKDVLEYAYSNRFIHPNIAFKRFKIGKEDVYKRQGLKKFTHLMFKKKLA